MCITDSHYCLRSRIVRAMKTQHANPQHIHVQWICPSFADDTIVYICRKIICLWHRQAHHYKHPVPWSPCKLIVNNYVCKHKYILIILTYLSILLYLRLYTCTNGIILWENNTRNN